MTDLFQNRQWTVTDWGLQSKKPGAPYEYDIVATRLLELSHGGPAHYDWPFHMAEKTWIDFDAFEEAFRKALDFHAGKYTGTVDAKALDESFEIGRKRIERR